MGVEPTTPTLARLTSIDPFSALDRCNSHERPICTLEHPIALRQSDVSSISPPVYVSCSRADQVGGYRTSADMRATRPTRLFREPEAMRGRTRPSSTQFL